jgi:hypothetical protein
MAKRLFFMSIFIISISIGCYSQNFTKEDIQWFEKNCTDVKTELKYEKNDAHHYCTYFFMSGDPQLDSLRYNHVSLILSYVYDIDGKNPDGNTVEYLMYKSSDFYLIYKGKNYIVSKNIIPGKSLKGENYRNTFSVMFEWYEK